MITKGCLSPWGLEFSSYEIELRNWVTQNDAPLRVTNSKVFIEILLSSYLLDFVKYWIKLWVTTSKVELLFFYFRVTNSKLKNKKIHFQLLTRWLNFLYFSCKIYQITFEITDWKTEKKRSFILYTLHYTLQKYKQKGAVIA